MPKLIMVIDDNPDILTLFEIILREEGYKVISYQHNLADELKLIKQVKPDLVIVDLMVTTRDLGWQLIQRMKLDPATAHIAIILCTTAVRRVRELEESLIEQGVRVILKPFDIEELLGAVVASDINPIFSFPAPTVDKKIRV